MNPDATNRPFFRIHINFKDIAMKWERIESNLDKFKGKPRQQWDKLSREQLDSIVSKRAQLAPGIQESYAISLGH